MPDWFDAITRITSLLSEFMIARSKLGIDARVRLADALLQGGIPAGAALLMDGDEPRSRLPFEVMPAGEMERLSRE
jgi:hypothetical protein